MSIPNLRSNQERMAGLRDSSYQDMDDFSNSFKYQQRPPKRGSKWHLLILILIGLGVIGGTVYLLKNQFPQASAPAPSPEATTEASPSPTPSPTPEFDRSQYKVRVLNGTSQTGLAATVSDKLKSLGYQGEKVGNATNSAFTKTVIRVKPTVTALGDQLVKDLMSDYSNATAEGQLRDSDAADAEVIIGKN